jgi:hypothetical protein
MKFHRIFDRPGGELLCTCCSDSNTPEEALAQARESPWIAQRMTDDACAVECEEVGEW